MEEKMYQGLLFQARAPYPIYEFEDYTVRGIALVKPRAVEYFLFRFEMHLVNPHSTTRLNGLFVTATFKSLGYAPPTSKVLESLMKEVWALEVKDCLRMFALGDRSTQGKASCIRKTGNQWEMGLDPVISGSLHYTDLFLAWKR